MDFRSLCGWPCERRVSRRALLLLVLVVIAQGARSSGRRTPPHLALFQTGIVSGKTLPQANANIDAPSLLLPLRRESVPVRRKGKVVSFKTSYSGALSVGSPKQDFRVVFDTGSAHVILPAIECENDTCLRHRRYNMTASTTASAINADGSLVLPGELTDQVAIGFGTGEVTGEFVKDVVCVGDADRQAIVSDPTTEICVDMFVVTAVEMSSQPFKSFNFDGIVGLGLSSLALSDNFSFFDWVVNTSKPQAPYFSFYLVEGDEAGGEESELALGGYNAMRALGPPSWAPVALPEQGHWQVAIRAIRVDGRTLDVCLDGTCRGVVDTGTSHLGVPAPYHHDIKDMLERRAGHGVDDCRDVDAPVLEIEVAGINLTLYAENYMRRMPLREDVSISSSKGVSAVSLQQEDAQLQKNAGGGTARKKAQATAKNENSSMVDDDEDDATIEQKSPPVAHWCRPRIMHVSLPEPLGPKLFLLGEPLLHRYYTVFDWVNSRVGFSLAANPRNKARFAMPVTV